MSKEAWELKREEYYRVAQRAVRVTLDLDITPMKELNTYLLENGETIVVHRTDRDFNGLYCLTKLYGLYDNGWYADYVLTPEVRPTWLMQILIERDQTCIKVIRTDEFMEKTENLRRTFQLNIKVNKANAEGFLVSWDNFVLCPSFKSYNTAEEEQLEKEEPEVDPDDPSYEKRVQYLLASMGENPTLSIGPESFEDDSEDTVRLF